MRAILLCLLLSVSCFADWVPDGPQSWHDGAKGKHTMGGIFNYQKPDSTWELIDSVWEASGDTAWVNNESYVKSMIWKDGRTRLDLDFLGHSLTIERQLIRFSWIDLQTWNHQTIFNVDFDDATEKAIAGRDAWAQFPGWSFLLRLGEHGAVAHIIGMKPVFLDSMSVLFNALPPVAQGRVALANIYKVNATLDDSVFLNDPHTWGKKIKQCGRFLFHSRRQYVHFPGYDTLTCLIVAENDDTIEVDFRLKVQQEWKKVGGQLYMAEYIKMKHLDSLHALYPTETFWHAASEEMTDNDVSDTWINGNLAQNCYNYGDQDYLWVVNGIGADQAYSFARCWNVEDIVRSDTFNACTLSLDLVTVTTAATVDCREVLKYGWVEGNQQGAACTDSGAVWKAWNGYQSGRICYNTYAWGDPGAQCKNDNGLYNNNGFSAQNCAADTVADTKSTAMSSVSCSSTPFTAQFDISPSVANFWFAYEDTNCGVMLQTATSSGEVKFNSSDIA